MIYTPALLLYMIWMIVMCTFGSITLRNIRSASHCFPIEKAGRQDFMHMIDLRAIKTLKNRKTMRGTQYLYVKVGTALVTLLQQSDLLPKAAQKLAAITFLFDMYKEPHLIIFRWEKCFFQEGGDSSYINDLCPYRWLVDTVQCTCWSVQIPLCNFLVVVFHSWKVF